MPSVIGGRLTTRPVARPPGAPGFPPWSASGRSLGIIFLCRTDISIAIRRKANGRLVPCVRGGKSAVDLIEAVNDVLIKFGKPGIAATASRNSKCCLRP